MNKIELRREMRRRLGAVDEGGDKSRAIVRAISAHPVWERVRVLSLFSALPGEPVLTALWEAGANIRFCYPRIEAAGMTFFEVRSVGELISASWHPRIREPAFDPARIVPPSEIDLMLVPGLAFTRDGQRLGRGGGYYDRYLAGLPASAAKLGICFQCQLVESLPLEAHDQRVHAIVTENGISGHFPAFSETRLASD